MKEIEYRKGSRPALSLAICASCNDRNQGVSINIETMKLSKDKLP
jgi:hypothetical protein